MKCHKGLGSCRSPRLNTQAATLQKFASNSFWTLCVLAAVQGRTESCLELFEVFGEYNWQIMLLT